FGYWVVKIAPFIDDTINGPHLDSNNIRTITPGGVQAFNESYGWSPDGSRLLFASCYNQFWPLDDQIYTMDTLGNNIKQMTSTAHSYPYTEHAFYNTTGTQILWMTNLDNMVGSSKGGDDWWIMNSDTTHQERLTYFNDTLCSYYTGSTHINGHGSFSPNGNKFIGDVGGSAAVQTNPAASIGANYIITSDYFTGVENVSQNTLQFSLYPNPNSGAFTLQVKSEELRAKSTVEIYNILGEKVYSAETHALLPHSGGGASFTYQINLGAVPSGVYFLKINNGTSSASKKFVVERK
ncbi:MAG TPA: T9SS type A sorting domain-containing protein, partial [Bacteroidia bacterium]|nr:T9SS type A sorting domain-containing protein [Bacteroidia bacterium]